MPLICGVDEAGRGPLVGSVVAAAVVLPEEGIAGLRDSKKLSAKRRDALYEEIISRARYGIGEASAAEIDELNILRATFLAMRRAVEKLALTDLAVIVDGNQLPNFEGLGVYSLEALVKGDDLVPAISAASILAKVTRDRQMLALDELYPQYGFARHQGYGTAVHLEALKRYGPCEQHRRSFRPVREAS